VTRADGCATIGIVERHQGRRRCDVRYRLTCAGLSLRPAVEAVML
jgi:DNA-binding HxlR family transcriptional regulator